MTTPLAAQDLQPYPPQPYPPVPYFAVINNNNNNNAAGGGGGGGGGNGSGKDNNQDTRTDPRHHSMLTRREHVNIDLVGNGNYSSRIGHITIIPTAHIPNRLVLTAKCYNAEVSDRPYSFIVDVLLVPISFHVTTCFDLYLEAFCPSPQTRSIGTHSLRESVILLRRMAVQGVHAMCAAKQWDIPEDVQTRTDYRLVITCPALYCKGGFDKLAVLLLLEMEFRLPSGKLANTF